MKRLSNTDQRTNKLENVPSPVNDTDASNKAYVDNGLTGRVRSTTTATLSVGDTAPTSPIIGDVWVDTSKPDPLPTNGLGIVTHGATASTARPTGFKQILWVGSVPPTNKTTNDIWWETE